MILAKSSQFVVFEFPGVFYTIHCALAWFCLHYRNVFFTFKLQYEFNINSEFVKNKIKVIELNYRVLRPKMFFEIVRLNFCNFRQFFSSCFVSSLFRASQPTGACVQGAYIRGD